MIMDAFAPQHYLDFWNFGILFLKGWGSYTPRTGGRLPQYLPQYSSDFALTTT